MPGTVTSCCLLEKLPQQPEMMEIGEKKKEENCQISQIIFIFLQLARNFLTGVKRFHLKPLVAFQEHATRAEREKE